MLSYPLDLKQILRNKKKIKKEILIRDSIKKNIKVAILGGSTTFELSNTLEIFLLDAGYSVKIYESDYNKYYEDAVFVNKNLKDFKPDVIWICTSVVNISKFPAIGMETHEIEKLFKSEMKKFESIWLSLQQYDCAIIQNNFDLPVSRSLGSLDAYSEYGRTFFINRLNIEFSKCAQKINSLYINDINYLSASIGLSNWFDANLWLSAKCAFSYDAIPHLAKSVSNIINAIFGKTKKCLVLDLDNTCWGGIIGDDGVQNICIGKETALAEAFSAFQLYVKELKDKGVLLAVCSKNNFETAKSGFEHPDSILKFEDFTSFKANWDPKSKNIAEIAKEINIGLDSLVFIDDNPAEREIVKQYAKQVEVPSVGDNIVDYIDHIDKNGYFESVSISKDDLKRNEFYQSNKKRIEIQDTFENYEEFLKSLDMRAEILPFSDVYLDRITQLTNKTNQFNLTTKRYTFGEIEAISKSSNYITLYGKLSDKFGDNGLVSVVIGKIEDKTVHIETWLMSCRVLKRGFEFAMMNQLMDSTFQSGIEKIVGYYYPTSKNAMVADFFDNFKFKKTLDTKHEVRWEIEISKYVQEKNYIKIN